MPQPKMTRDQLIEFLLAQRAQQQSGGGGQVGGAGAGVSALAAYNLAKSAGLLGGEAAASPGLISQGLTALGEYLGPQAAQMSSNIAANYLPSVGSQLTSEAAPMMSTMGSGAGQMASQALGYAGPALMVGSALYTGYNAMKDRGKREKARDEVTKGFKDKGYSRDNLNAKNVMTSPEVQALIDSEGEAGKRDFSSAYWTKQRYDNSTERDRLKGLGVTLDDDKLWKSGGKSNMFGKLTGRGSMMDQMVGRSGGYGQKRDFYEGMKLPTNVNPLYGGDMKNIDSGNFEFQIGDKKVSIPSASFLGVPQTRPTDKMQRKPETMKIGTLIGFPQGGKDPNKYREVPVGENGWPDLSAFTSQPSTKPRDPNWISPGVYRDKKRK
jgi:hypothetical protein